MPIKLRKLFKIIFLILNIDSPKTSNSQLFGNFCLDFLEPFKIDIGKKKLINY